MENPPDLHISPPPPRSRRRTPLLLCTAVLLGAAGGIAGGYTVQAEREPTELPPLAQAKVGIDHNPRVSGADAPRNKTAGDLRKLLISAPEGTKSSPLTGQEGEWMAPYVVAAEYEDPGGKLGDSLADGFRRAAGISWLRANQATHVWITQYRDATYADSRSYLVEELNYEPNYGLTREIAEPIPGSTNGFLFVHTKPSLEPGYLPQYRARAIARRGNVVMEIFVYDTAPISSAYIKGMAKKQLERL